MKKNNLGNRLHSHSTGNVYIVMHEVEANAGKEKIILNEIIDSNKELQNQSGLIQYTVMKKANDSGKIVALSMWESKESFDVWKSSESFKKAHGENISEIFHKAVKGFKTENYQLVDGWHPVMS
ncbi:MAG: hypothetical protein APR63_08300 [Desulfuromonas sp. SDB]|nr:MAG: hypothetical protein APR63_08300 [Desulfuromonas sp. SDB]